MVDETVAKTDTHQTAVIRQLKGLFSEALIVVLVIFHGSIPLLHGWQDPLIITAPTATTE